MQWEAEIVNRDSPGRLARYLEQLTARAGAEPNIEPLLPLDEEVGRVLAVSYADTPQRGYVTGFSYGLSLASHADWPPARPELSITVRSDDLEWAKVPARLVAALRGRSAFNQGQAFGYAGRFVEGSTMTSILVADAAVGWPPGSVDVGPDEPLLDDRVNVMGVYPIHASERDFVYSRGFDDFWGLEWDRLDPTRPPVV